MVFGQALESLLKQKGKTLRVQLIGVFLAKVCRCNDLNLLSMQNDEIMNIIKEMVVLDIKFKCRFAIILTEICCGGFFIFFFLFCFFLFTTYVTHSYILDTNQ